LRQMASAAASTSAEDRKRRREGREEERERLLKQIHRGLDEIDAELRNFAEAYSKFVGAGGECDERLASWTKFFNEVALVSEDRVESGKASRARLDESGIDA
jgi:hypothetical protein